MVSVNKRQKLKLNFGSKSSPGASSGTSESGPAQRPFQFTSPFGNEGSSLFGNTNTSRPTSVDSMTSSTSSVSSGSFMENTGYPTQM